MRTWTALACLFVMLVAGPGAMAEDRDPTPAEIATMILDGNAAEHELVAAWLAGAERSELRQVFAKLRSLRRARSASVEARLESVPLAPAPKPKDPFAAHEGPLVNAEVKILQIPVKAMAALLGAKRPTAEQSHFMLTDAEVTKLMRAVEKQDGAEQISAPRLTVYDRQKANVSILNQVSYIQDYDLEVSNEVTIADPIIGVIQEGILIDFTPSCAKDGRTIQVAFEGTFSSLQRPIPEKEISLAGGAGKKVTIQLPQLEIGRIRETVEVADGGWVLMGGGVTFQTEKGAPRVERVALMHLKRMELKDHPVRRKK